MEVKGNLSIMETGNSSPTKQSLEGVFLPKGDKNSS